jgi:hypothetical protein
VIPGSERAHEHAVEKRSSLQSLQVSSVDGRSADPDQHLPVTGYGRGDLLESEDVGRAIPVLDYRSHARTAGVIISPSRLADPQMPERREPVRIRLS